MSDLATLDPAAGPARSRGLLANPFVRFVLATTVVIGVIAASFGNKAGAVLNYIVSQNYVPHAPNLALLAEASPAVKVHLGAAMLALTIGAILFAGVKGNLIHRSLGWGYVILLMVTAVSSFSIRTINHGQFSFVHLLAGWTVIALPLAVFFARTHRVDRHRRAMTGLFFGGLILAGLLAFLPTRLLYEMFMR